MSRCLADIEGELRETFLHSEEKYVYFNLKLNCGRLRYIQMISNYVTGQTIFAWNKSPDRMFEGKSAYITIWRWDAGKKGLHARLIMHLTVVAWRWARPVEQKVGRHHRFQRQADSLTIAADRRTFHSIASRLPAFAHRPSLKRIWGAGGGVKGYGWKKQQWWETVTAQWAWHVEWTHSVQPAHSSQATKLDPLPIHERQTSDSTPVKLPGMYVYQWAIAPPRFS